MIFFTIYGTIWSSSACKLITLCAVAKFYLWKQSEWLVYAVDFHRVIGKGHKSRDQLAKQISNL